MVRSISYCSADGAHGNVFGFIATNPNETLECHAYLCPKRKVAQTVTLAVAQSFNAAYELWQLTQLDSRIYHAAEDKSPQLNGDDDDDDDDDAGDKDGEDDHCDDGDDDDAESGKKGKALDEKSPGERRKSKSSLHRTKKSSKIELDQTTNCKSKVESAWVSFENETSNARNDTSIKPLKSPISPTLTSSTVSSSSNNSNNDSTPPLSIKSPPPPPSSTTIDQTKLIASTWSESETSRKLDLVCSS